VGQNALGRVFADSEPPAMRGGPGKAKSKAQGFCPGKENWMTGKRKESGNWIFFCNPSFISILISAARLACNIL